MSFETIILKNLVYNEEYTRKVFPYLKEDYFEGASEKKLYNEISGYLSKYNTNPSIEALSIQLGELSVNEKEYQSVLDVLEEIYNTRDDVSDNKWLIEKTEKYCQDRSLYLAVTESINILDNDKSTKQDKGAIPQLLTDALAVCFDAHVGHDYFDDVEKRYEYYHSVEEKIPFDLNIFNVITNQGLPKKTLNILVAGTNVGKTLMMSHFAGHYLQSGYNVLYITLEMSEEEIAKRIDANILDIDINQFDKTSKDDYFKKIKKLKEKSCGKLIVRQYPTAGAGTTHFRALMNELKIKKSFIPDILIVDYMNICTSSKLRMGSNVNTYSYVKSIAEELRGLAVEYDIPVLTATQLNRAGGGSSDPTMENTSDSYGTGFTADWMVAVITNDVLAKLNQLQVKQLKSRYCDKRKNNKFIIGVDYSHMRLYEVEEAAQDSSENEDLEETEEKDIEEFFDTQDFKSKLNTPSTFKPMNYANFNF